jgi:hypothetical protein
MLALENQTVRGVVNIFPAANPCEGGGLLLLMDEFPPATDHGGED